MAVTFVGLGTAEHGSGSLSCPVPTGTAAGDLLLLWVCSENQPIAAPSGWTEVGTAGGVGSGTAGGAPTAANIQLFTKTAGASEGNVAVADSGNITIGWVEGFRGASGIDSSGRATTANSSDPTPIDAAAYTTHQDGTMLSWASCLGLAKATGVGPWSTTHTYSGFTDDGSTTGGGFLTLALAHGILATAGTVTSPSASLPYTSSSTTGVSMVVGIVPTKTTAAVAGVLGKATGAATVHNKIASAVAGVLGKMTGTATVHNKIASAIAGVLGKVTGVVNLLDKDGIAIAGTLAKVTGAAAVTNKMQVAIAGMLARLTGAGAIANKNALTVAGGLPKVTGEANLLETEDAAIVGTLAPVSGAAAVANTMQAAVAGVLAGVTGAAAVTNTMQAAVAGVLGAITGEAFLLQEGAIIIAGALAKVTGAIEVMLGAVPTITSEIAGVLGAASGSINMLEGDGLAIEGTLQKATGAIGIQMAERVAVAGLLKSMSGSFILGNDPPCYAIEDDRRELILARLAVVLAGVEGVAAFYRNDPSIVEALMPALLLLDGDETAGIPRGWDKGRPAPFPMMVAMHPEVYLMVEQSVGSGATLNLLQDRIVKAVLNDSELQALCRDQWLLYEGSRVAFSLGRALEGEMGINFTFNYMLDPQAVCQPLPDDPAFNEDTVRETILSAMARAVSAAEGVTFFRRNEISRPENIAPAVFMLDGDEFVDPDLYKAGRPPTVPKPAAADPELYAVINEGPATVGPRLNQLRLMVLRTVLNDPLLTRLAADRDIRYEGVQTGLALGRSMAGEMGLKFSVHYVLRP